MKRFMCCFFLLKIKRCVVYFFIEWCVKIMKKGFTLVELLAVFAIMILLLLMAVPIYTGITDSINEKLKESKMQNVLLKSEVYASESGRIVFDIQTLIQEGILEPDNELGEYKDPITDRDMRCDIVNAMYENDGYQITITPNDECYTEEDLESLHGLVELVVTKPDGSAITTVDDWTKESEVVVQYRLKEGYQEYESGIEEILWYGEGEKNCNTSNLSECNSYSVSTESVLNTEIHFQIKIKMKESIIQNEAYVKLQMDHEYPIFVEGSRVVAEGNTNANKRVQFEITDRGGSGVSGYSVVTYTGGALSCQGVTFKEASDGLQTEYLGNGSYYICVRDKVGNVIDDDELNKNKDKYLFQVDNVNKDAPVFGGSDGGIKISSTMVGYNSLDARAIITARNSEGNTNGLKVCVSEVGYLKECSWEDYGSEESYTEEIHFSGSYETGELKTLYVTIQDANGNTAQKAKEYRLYKYCDQKSSWKEVSNTSSSCPKCGNANYTSTKKLEDKYFSSHVCETKTDTIKCNIPSNCCESSALVYSSWSSWSSCSASCGTSGTQYRTRTATSKYNGQSCSISGSNQRQEQACNRRDCCESSALVYSDWSSWSTCSKTCGGGTQYRTRTATSKYNGQSCSISGTNQRQEQACNTQSCGLILFDSTTSISDDWRSWTSNNGYGYISSTIYLSASSTGDGGTSTKYLTAMTPFSVSSYTKMVVEQSYISDVNRFTVKLCNGVNTTASGEYKPRSCYDFKYRTALSKEILDNGHHLVTYDISALTGNKYLSVVLSTKQTMDITIYSIKLIN